MGVAAQQGRRRRRSIRQATESTEGANHAALQPRAMQLRTRAQVASLHRRMPARIWAGNRTGNQNWPQNAQGYCAHMTSSTCASRQMLWWLLLQDREQAPGFSAFRCSCCCSVEEGCAQACLPAWESSTARRDWQPHSVRTAHQVGLGM